MDSAPAADAPPTVPATAAPPGRFSQRRIDRAIRDLADRHEESARHAEVAFAALTGGDGLEALTQERLQRYLWMDLPCSVTEPDRADACAAVVDAVARVFDRLAEPSYAALCRSSATLEALAAWETDDASGVAAFARLQDASGAAPVDTPTFAWSAQPGPEEQRARDVAAGALQSALRDGELQPGVAGWRRRRQAVVERALDTPSDRPVAAAPADDPDLELVDWRERLQASRHPDATELATRAATWRRRVELERLEAWRRSRGPTRTRLSTAVGRLLAEVPAVPAGAAAALAPLCWLLAELEPGVAATPAGRLPPEVVTRAVARFGWRGPGGRPPRSETDVRQLEETHVLARRIGAVARLAGQLRTTDRGRRLRRDVQALWRAVAADLTASERGWRAGVDETLLAVLVAERRAVSREDLLDRAGRIVVEEGWRTPRGGAPDPWELDAAVVVTLSTLDLLGLLESTDAGPRGRREAALNATGRAFALASLHAAATAPQGLPGVGPGTAGRHGTRTARALGA